MRTSRSTRSASSVGRLGQRRTRACPSRSSTSGGFHIAIRRSARGAPSRSTSSTSEAGEALGQLHRVGDRGAREQEARLGAVGARQAPQPAQHVGHVRAEHAAVDVRLVHDHPGQVGQHVAPLAVVGQHAHVQHVGVGEDQVRALADRAPLLARGVAVVDRVAQEAGRRAARACAPGPGPAPWSGRGRARGRRAVAGERVEHRQVEGQRLAAGRAGGDDRVAAHRRPRARRPGATRAPRCRRPRARRAGRGGARPAPAS